MLNILLYVLLFVYIVVFCCYFVVILIFVIVVNLVIFGCVVVCSCAALMVVVWAFPHFIRQWFLLLGLSFNHILANSHDQKSSIYSSTSSLIVIVSELMWKRHNLQNAPQICLTQLVFLPLLVVFWPTFGHVFFFFGHICFFYFILFCLVSWLWLGFVWVAKSLFPSNHW